MFIVQLDFEHCVRKALHHSASNFYIVLLAHIAYCLAFIIGAENLCIVRSVAYEQQFVQSREPNTSSGLLPPSQDSAVEPNVAIGNFV